MPTLPAARSWTPLLEGALRREALEAVRAVAAEMPPPEAVPEAGPAGGNAGIALFFAALERFEPERGHGARAEAHLDHALQAADLALGPNLYTGFTGVGWALERLQGGTSDPNADTDAALAHLLDRGWGRGRHDLVAGLAGVGLYALARAHRPSGRAVLARVVEQLLRGAAPDGPGFTWFTPPDQMPDWERAMYPAGCANLGLAHGVPAPLAVLAGAVGWGVGGGEARRVLEGAVAWLLAQENGSDAPSRFPTVRAPGGTDAEPEPRDSRVAWCYGDLGLAVALWNAGRAAGEPAWEAEGLRIARGAAARPFEGSRVADAGFCHGAAGNAHLFNRLWQGSGDPAFAEAARAWTREALRYRRPGQGIGGFQAWWPGNEEGRRWVTDPGLLEGSTGVALALLAALDGSDPDWDGLLLASLPLDGR